MTRDEVSLLLYFESCAVDHNSCVDTEAINEQDMEIVQKWVGEKFVEFGRIKFEDTHKCKSSYWVHLSDKAWKQAAKQRRLRADKIWANRRWRKAGEI